MPIIVDLVAIVVALKLAEATGGLEFDGWGGVLGAALVCWFGGWTDFLLLLAFPSPESMQSPIHLKGLALAMEVIATMVLLLVAWALVPGAHIRRFHGLIAASILIVGLRFAATALIPAIGLGL